MSYINKINAIRKSENPLEVVRKISRRDIIDWLKRDRKSRMRFLQFFDLDRAFCVLWRGENGENITWDCMYVSRVYDHADDVRDVINDEIKKSNYNRCRAWLDRINDLFDYDSDVVDSVLEYLLFDVTL